ncbi:MAG: hypothetical protein H6674_10740 [Dehalococcoidia bacterium]|nr:hypothetical protein [Dehalococcoidia bacterium]
MARDERPELQSGSATLRSYLDEVTSRVVGEVIHTDVEWRRWTSRSSSP